MNEEELKQAYGYFAKKYPELTPASVDEFKSALTDKDKADSLYAQYVNAGEEMGDRSYFNYEPPVEIRDAAEPQFSSTDNENITSQASMDRAEDENAALVGTNTDISTPENEQRTRQANADIVLEDEINQKKEDKSLLSFADERGKDLREWELNTSPNVQLQRQADGIQRGGERAIQKAQAEEQRKRSALYKTDSWDEYSAVVDPIPEEDLESLVRIRENRPGIAYEQDMGRFKDYALTLNKEAERWEKAFDDKYGLFGSIAEKVKAEQPLEPDEVAYLQEAEDSSEFKNYIKWGGKARDLERTQKSIEANYTDYLLKVKDRKQEIKDEDEWRRWGEENIPKAIYWYGREAVHMAANAASKTVGGLAEMGLDFAGTTGSRFVDGADIFNNWADGVAEWAQDAAFQSSSVYNRSSIENIAEFEGKRVITDNGKVKRVIDEDGYDLEVDDDFAKRFEEANVEGELSVSGDAFTRAMSSVIFDVAITRGLGRIKHGVEIATAAQMYSGVKEEGQRGGLTTDEAVAYAALATAGTAAIARIGNVEAPVQARMQAGVHNTVMGAIRSGAGYKEAVKIYYKELKNKAVEEIEESIKEGFEEGIAENFLMEGLKEGFDVVTGSNLAEGLTVTQIAEDFALGMAVSGVMKSGDFALQSYNFTPKDIRTQIDNRDKLSGVVTRSALAEKQFKIAEERSKTEKSLEEAEWALEAKMEEPPTTQRASDIRELEAKITKDKNYLTELEKKSTDTQNKLDTLESGQPVEADDLFVNPEQKTESEKAAAKKKVDDHVAAVQEVGRLAENSEAIQRLPREQKEQVLADMVERHKKERNISEVPEEAKRQAQEIKDLSAKIDEQLSTPKPLDLKPGDKIDYKGETGTLESINDKGEYVFRRDNGMKVRISPKSRAWKDIKKQEPKALLREELEEGDPIIYKGEEASYEGVDKNGRHKIRKANGKVSRITDKSKLWESISRPESTPDLKSDIKQGDKVNYGDQEAEYLGTDSKGKHLFRKADGKISRIGENSKKWSEISRSSQPAEPTRREKAKEKPFEVEGEEFTPKQKVNGGVIAENSKGETKFIPDETLDTSKPNFIDSLFEDFQTESGDNAQIAAAYEVINRLRSKGWDVVEMDSAAFKKEFGKDAAGATKDGKLYLNTDIMTDVTVFHEALHPIMTHMRETNPEEYNEMVQDVVNFILERPELRTEYMDSFLEAYKNDGVERLREELVTEFFANVLSDPANLEAKKKKPLMRMIKDFFSKWGAKLGLSADQIQSLSAEKEENIRKFADVLQRTMYEGNPAPHLPEIKYSKRHGQLRNARKFFDSIAPKVQGIDQKTAFAIVEQSMETFEIDYPTAAAMMFNSTGILVANHKKQSLRGTARRLIVNGAEMLPAHFYTQRTGAEIAADVKSQYEQILERTGNVEASLNIMFQAIYESQDSMKDAGESGMVIPLAYAFIYKKAEAMGLELANEVSEIWAREATWSAQLLAANASRFIGEEFMTAVAALSLATKYQSGREHRLRESQNTNALEDVANELNDIVIETEQSIIERAIKTVAPKKADAIIKLGTKIADALFGRNNTKFSNPSLNYAAASQAIIDEVAKSGAPQRAVNALIRELDKTMTTQEVQEAVHNILAVTDAAGQDTASRLADLAKVKKPVSTKVIPPGDLREIIKRSIKTAFSVDNKYKESLASVLYSDPYFDGTKEDAERIAKVIEADRKAKAEARVRSLLNKRKKQAGLDPSNALKPDVAADYILRRAEATQNPQRVLDAYVKNLVIAGLPPKTIQKMVNDLMSHEINGEPLGKLLRDTATPKKTVVKPDMDAYDIRGVMKRSRDLGYSTDNKSTTPLATLIQNDPGFEGDAQAAQALADIIESQRKADSVTRWEAAMTKGNKKERARRKKDLVDKLSDLIGSNPPNKDAVLDRLAHTAFGMSAFNPEFKKDLDSLLEILNMNVGKELTLFYKREVQDILRRMEKTTGNSLFKEFRTIAITNALSGWSTQYNATFGGLSTAMSAVLSEFTSQPIVALRALSYMLKRNNISTLDDMTDGQRKELRNNPFTMGVRRMFSVMKNDFIAASRKNLSTDNTERTYTDTEEGLTTAYEMFVLKSWRKYLKEYKNADTPWAHGMAMMKLMVAGPVSTIGRMSTMLAGFDAAMGGNLSDFHAYIAQYEEHVEQNAPSRTYKEKWNTIMKATYDQETLNSLGFTKENRAEARRRLEEEVQSIVSNPTLMEEMSVKGKTYENGPYKGYPVLNSRWKGYYDRRLKDLIKDQTVTDAHYIGFKRFKDSVLMSKPTGILPVGIYAVMNTQAFRASAKTVSDKISNEWARGILNLATLPVTSMFWFGRILSVSIYKLYSYSPFGIGMDLATGAVNLARGKGFEPTRFVGSEGAAFGKPGKAIITAPKGTMKKIVARAAAHSLIGLLAFMDNFDEDEDGNIIPAEDPFIRVTGRGKGSFFDNQGTGDSAYTLKIGELEFSYKYILPLVPVLTAIGENRDFMLNADTLSPKEKEEAYENYSARDEAIKSFVSIFGELSFARQLQVIKRTWKDFTDENKEPVMAGRDAVLTLLTDPLAAGVRPNLVKEANATVNRFMGNPEISTSNRDGWTEAANKIKRGIPFVEYLGDDSTQTDVFGNEMARKFPGQELIGIIQELLGYENTANPNFSQPEWEVIREKGIEAPAKWFPAKRLHENDPILYKKLQSEFEKEFGNIIRKNLRYIENKEPYQAREYINKKRQDAIDKISKKYGLKK